MIWKIITAVFSFSLLVNNLAISDSWGTAKDVDLTWTGSSYGLVWSDARQGEREIRFTKLNDFGTQVTKELEISDSPAENSENPRIIWANNCYTLVWQEDNYLYFTRLDKDGDKAGRIKKITKGTNPDIVWDGLNYGLVYLDEEKIYFLKLDYAGVKKSQPIEISQGLSSANPRLVWNGSEYALVWPGEKGVYFQELNREGQSKTGIIKVNQLMATSTNPEIVWQGNGYGLIWQSKEAEKEEQVYFAQLDKNGHKQIEKSVQTAVGSSIIWQGEKYGLLWQTQDNQLYFVNLDKKGHWENKPVKILEADGQANQPIIALGNSKYALAWLEARSGQPEVYFGQLYFSDLSASIFNGYNWLVILLIAGLAAVIIIKLC